MWKPVIQKFAVGGSIDEWNKNVGVPDPGMYRSEARNLKNIQSYIKSQGGMPEQSEAASLLSKFQQGQMAEPEEAPIEELLPTLSQVGEQPSKPRQWAPLNLDEEITDPVRLVGFGSSAPGLSSSIGSLGGRYASGGTIDYRNGGPVVGGPPGQDTVPVVARPGGPVKAMLDNGEYILPKPTVATVGKQGLDALVKRTTGQPPVGYKQPGVQGYARGGVVEPTLTPEEIARRLQQAADAGKASRAAPPTPPPAPRNVGSRIPSAEAQEYMAARNAADAQTRGWKAGAPATAPAGAPATTTSRSMLKTLVNNPVTRTAGKAAGSAVLPVMAVADAFDSNPNYNEHWLPNTSMLTREAAKDAVHSLKQGEYVDAAGQFIRGVGGGIAGLGADTINAAGSLVQPVVRAGIGAVTGKAPEAQELGGTGFLGFGRNTAWDGPATTEPAPPPPTVGSPEVPAGAGQLSDAAPEPTTQEAPNKPQRLDVAPEYQDQLGQAVFTNQPEAETLKNLGATIDPQGLPESRRRNSLGLSPGAFSRTGGGFVGEVGGAPAGVDDAAYAAMSTAEKSAAKVASINAATQAIRDLRNARREANGLPAVGEKDGGLATLKPSEQIAFANLMRRVGNDQRAAAQDQFMNSIRVDERLEGRQQAQAAVQDRRMKRAEPFMQSMGVDFPGMEDSSSRYFQRATKLADPEQAYQALAANYELMRRSTDTEPLFTVEGQVVTPAQAIAILNGERPFDGWLPGSGAGDEFYEEARRMAAAKLQELALGSLSQ